MAFEPLYELTRGSIVEAVHCGAIAVVDVTGRLLASVGDPRARVFMRSSAKPFQALAMVEAGTPEAFGLTQAELALACASHIGSDEHAEVARGMQRKAHASESDLMCGTHPVEDALTARRIACQGQSPTPSHHNCSGKHAAMLAFARRRGAPLEDYVNPQHPIQQTILRTVAEMFDMRPAEVVLGIDGCSAPNFAVPLAQAALGFARFADPQYLPSARMHALQTLWTAMTTYPELVQGAGRFDTELMRCRPHQLVAKGGAEGYQAVALAPTGKHPALGITLKIADGQKRGAQGAMLEVLRQMDLLEPSEFEALARYDFRPRQPLRNNRGVVVGEARPCFRLNLGD